MNVLIGGTNCEKTHQMKILYAVCLATEEEREFDKKLVRVFL